MCGALNELCLAQKFNFFHCDFQNLIVSCSVSVLHTPKVKFRTNIFESHRQNRSKILPRGPNIRYSQQFDEDVFVSSELL